MKFDFEELKEVQKNISILKKRTEKFLSDQGTFLNLESPDFHTDAKSLKELKIAVIMDEFTLYCYQPECTLLEVSPVCFEQELDSFLPDMLFVESAWNGNHGRWREKLAHGSREYFALAAYCKKRKIPIVFWNKEDPFHFDDFLIIAKTADFIFTTDSDMIPRYRSHITSDKIYHLHFAAQPTLHNPLEIGTRQDKFCFAGAYYRCYPERAEIFERFAQIFLSTRGLVIYDREYGKKRSAYRFPSKYRPYILGNLKADEIEKAHKGYVFGVNMNTVTMSSTMFSRRVFELMASNTVTVSNFAQGLENYFGNLTICTNDTEELISKLEKYCSTETDIHKYRLLGLRKILTNHLYEDRLNDIADKLFHLNLKKRLPDILVISQAENEKECEWVIAEFENQTYDRKQLLLFYDSKIILKNCNQHLNANEKQISLGDIMPSGYIAYFHPRDYYAANYLYDLAYSLRYYNSPIVCKDAFYYFQSSTLCYHSGELYTLGKYAAIRRSIVDVKLVANVHAKDFLLQRDIAGNVLYIDEWNYCENVNCDKCGDVEDMKLP